MAETFPDDRLKVMFTCCHQALLLEAQVALTQHTLDGLSIPQVARAYLLRYAEQPTAAAAAYQQALTLCTDLAERANLERLLDQLLRLG